MCSVGWLKGDRVMPATYTVDSRCCIPLSPGPVKCLCLLNGAAESQQDFLARHCCNAAFLLPFWGFADQKWDVLLEDCADFTASQGLALCSLYAAPHRRAARLCVLHLCCTLA